jgi:signal transduction histidine kinase
MEEQERIRQMEELATLKEDFTEIVAHELAAPVATIIIMTDLLSSGKLSAEQGTQAASTIREEARLVDRLIKDVQASAAAGHHEFEIDQRRVAVASLFDDAKAYADTLPGTHPMTVEDETDAFVWADPERIAQVLRNLLSNAGRYTPPGTPITLRATLVGDEVAIEVIDQGLGIDPLDRARIFEQFGRGRGAVHHYAAGRGLGLYLSCRIVQAHGSDLSVESEPGHGATFRFTLRLAP